MKIRALVLQKSNVINSTVFIPQVPREKWLVSLQRQLTTECSPRVFSHKSDAAEAKHTTNLREEASKRKHGDKDLFLNVLESTATKREAKAYLSRFGSKSLPPQIQGSLLPKIHDAGVNLGNLYIPGTTTYGHPVSSTELTQSGDPGGRLEILHVALVKIRAPQSIDDPTLHGIAHTLSQLVQLGLCCVVVVDPANGPKQSSSEEGRVAAEQADRFVEVMEVYGDQGARRLDSIIGVSAVSEECLPSVKLQGRIRITSRDSLLAPLRRGTTPILAPIGFTSDGQTLVPVGANEVILALTREFRGLQTHALFEEHAEGAAEKVMALQKQISLDRIIVLDPLGGIPTTDDTRGSHIFINLDQEFDAIKRDLVRAEVNKTQGTKSLDPSPKPVENSETLTATNPTFENLGADLSIPNTGDITETDVGTSNLGIHVQNLELFRDALALLPPSSSAFLTTPDAVANSESRPPLANQESRVKTRRQRNPLIHNLLTDKPVLSSSLPSNHSSSPTASASFPVIPISPATFFKRGMPVGIFPNPLMQPWAPPSPSNPSISMSDPRIDLPRLVHLIDDSFNRKLDVPHYLNRIKDRIAGIIIAGEYEGGAILTWETPPGGAIDDPDHMVPYLDKFAVLKRSQGAGGVADIVFKAMVRECFPNGVCWRSRKSNPINKWYFERAKGTWKIPKTNWTMFWTTEGIEVGDRLFSNYEGVCRAVEPSWADHKSVAD